MLALSKLYPKTLICECDHCGERYGGNNGLCARYCKGCRLASQRKLLTEENKKIRLAR